MSAEAQLPAVAEALLSVRSISLSYAKRSLLRASDTATPALLDVSLDLSAGKTLAIIGPSGSGKSSLARCILALERPQSGAILFRGNDVLTMSREALRAVRREVHLIFQESASALNPSFSVEKVLREPLAIHEPSIRRDQQRRRILEALERVELPAALLARRPLELSGGQRQRVAIARALMLEPKLLILDEAFSSLDLSTQGQIANLLLDLQERDQLAYLYITHDAALARLLAHEVVVLSAGRVVQCGSPTAVLTGNLQLAPQALAGDSASSETVSASPLPRSD